MPSPKRVKLARKTFLPQECRSFKQLAGESGLSPSTVKRYVRLHRLPVIRGSRRLVLVPESVWRAFWSSRAARWQEAYGE